MPSRSRPIAPAVVLLLPLVALFPALPARSQEGRQAEGGDAPTEVFLDTVDVDVVNVEVVVTDADGNPIHGLTREDFVVREDGEPVELTNFYAVRGGQRLVLEGEAEAEPGGDVGAEAGAEAFSPLPADQRLNLVILIDNLNISPTSRNGILRELDRRLDRVLRPGDRAMVAAANPEVRVVLPFTEDRSAVTAAIEQVELTVSRGTLLRADERTVRREIDEGAAMIAAEGVGNSLGILGGGTGEDPEDQARETLDMIRSWVEERHTHNLRLLGTMTRFVHALAGLPGRRAVLYVSDGFTVRPAEGLMEDWYEVFFEEARAVGVLSPESEAVRWDSTSELVELTEVAAGNRVTFYTLESASPFHESLDPEIHQAGSLSRLTDLTSEGSLSELAWRTGGVTLLNSGNIEVLLARMASDYRNYYSLGYASDHARDGEFRSIRVDVPGRKVRVRHSLGYREAGPEQQTMERTMTALVFDVADNPMGILVEVGEERPEKRDRYLLPVLVRVPISSLTLLPGQSIHQAKVSLVVAIQNAEGELSEPQLLDLPVEIPNDRLREAIGMQVAKAVNLLLREGQSKLAVGVRDELSGTTSTLNLNLSVGGGG